VFVVHVLILYSMSSSVYMLEVRALEIYIYIIIVIKRLLPLDVHIAADR